MNIPYFLSNTHILFVYYPVRNTGDNQHDQSFYNVASPDSSDSEMETTFSTSKPEAEMVEANPLYESAGFTEQSGAKGASNLLYELVSLTEMDGAGAKANPGVSRVNANPLYERAPAEEEMRGEENYGASGDEDGGDEKL